MPSLSELLISNPNGWGINPPAQVYDGDITNALDPRADYIGQKYGPGAGALAQRLLNAGVHVRDTAKGIAKGLSGIGMAEEAGDNLAHAVDAGDPIGAAGSIAQGGLAAIPAAGRYAEPLIRTTPRLASFLMTAGAAPVAASGIFAPTEAEAKPRAKAPIAEAPAETPPADNGLSPDQNARLVTLQKDVSRGNWRTGAERRSKEAELRQLQDLSADYSRNKNAAATKAAEIEATARAQREADAAAAEQKAAEEKAALDQPFQARHPKLSMALTLGAPIASGALSAVGLGRVAGKGKSLLSQLLQAREAGDVTKMAESAAALDKWQRSAPLKQALSIGLPATLPAEARAVGDVTDRYGLPPSSKAQQAAKERLSNVPEYLKDSLSGVMTGLAVGGAIGTKLAPSAPRGDAKAMLSLYGGKDPATLSQLLRDGADASASAQGPIGRFQTAHQARVRRNQQVDSAAATSEEALGGAPPSLSSSEPVHHSVLQPRKKGRFSGPPKRSSNDE